MKTRCFQIIYSLFIQKIKFLNWALFRAWGNREQQDSFFGFLWPLCPTSMSLNLYQDEESNINEKSHLSEEH